MTCRDEILNVVPALASASPDGTFTAEDVIAAMAAVGTQYTRGTIRTHVVSRMAANTSDHHAKTYADLIRVSRGRYRLR